MTAVAGEHIVLKVAAEDLNHLHDPRAWVAKLDRIYEAYADLVGAAPFGGKKITILAVEKYPGGWAVSGNPIQWHRRHVVPTFKNSVNKGDWSFGIAHEISHDFDLDDRWNWASALVCNFKMDYAFEKTKAVVFFQDRICDYADPESPRVTDVYRSNEAKLGYGAGCRMLHGGWGKDAYHHKLTEVVDEIGWEPFRQVFRWFNALEPEELARDPLGKRSLFVLALEEKSGVKLSEKFIDWGFAQLTVKGAKNARAAARAIRAKDWRMLDVDRPIRTAKDERVTLSVKLLAREPVTFKKGLGTHPYSETVYDLAGRYRRFESVVGVPGKAPAEGRWGSVRFEVVADGKKVYASPILRGGGVYERVALDVRGVKELKLTVNDAGDGPWGDGCAWADAKVIDKWGRVKYLSDLKPASLIEGYGGLHKDRCINDEPLTFVYGPCSRGAQVVGRLEERMFKLLPGTAPGRFEHTLDRLEAGTHLVRLKIRIGNCRVTQHELVTVIVGG
ncbi:MAG: NPCBM/NEW2 domain-containing protein [Planctomycetota bacterium]|jgi:hypothetical protein